MSVATLSVQESVTWVLESDLHAHDKMVCVTILTLARDGEPAAMSVDDLARYAGISTASTKRSTARLRELGLLEITRRSTAEGFATGSRENLYRVVLDVS